MTELEQLIQYWKDCLSRQDVAYETETKMRATIKYLEELKAKIEEDEIRLKGITLLGGELW